MRYETWETTKYPPGLKTGKLTVVSTHKKRRQNGSLAYYVFCKCECGSENKMIGISDFAVAKSCGCVKGGWRGPRSERYKSSMSEGHIKKGIMPRTDKRSEKASHHNWKGGVIYNNGYKLVMCDDPGHPHKIQGKYIYEHRRVMEKSIGRYLSKTEKVHHINGDITDNRIENLVLCQSNSDHFKRFHKSILSDLMPKIPSPQCPRCGSAKTGSRGKKSYQCRSCMRLFSKTGRFYK